MEVNSLSNIYLRQLGEQRPCISGLCPSIFSNNGLERNSIVEITGNDGSGKTFFLMHLMAHCLTQCDVILIDLSHKIDVQMLGKLVEHAVKEANPESSTENLQEIVGKCMDSLHIINCFSSDQVRMAIKALDHHILINNPKIGLIAVDGLSEFYWSDLQPNRPLSKYMYYMNLLEKLNTMCKKFFVCCMYSLDSRCVARCPSYIPIEHKLYINFSNGNRTLNGKLIIFNESGVQYEDE